VLLDLYFESLDGVILEKKEKKKRDEGVRRS